MKAAYPSNLSPSEEQPIVAASGGVVLRSGQAGKVAGGASGDVLVGAGDARVRGGHLHLGAGDVVRPGASVSGAGANSGEEAVAVAGSVFLRAGSALDKPTGHFGDSVQRRLAVVRKAQQQQQQTQQKDGGGVVPFAEYQDEEGERAAAEFASMGGDVDIAPGQGAANFGSPHGRHGRIVLRDHTLKPRLSLNASHLRVGPTK